MGAGDYNLNYDILFIYIKLSDSVILLMSYLSISKKLSFFIYKLLNIKVFTIILTSIKLSYRLVSFFPLRLLYTQLFMESSFPSYNFVFH